MPNAALQTLRHSTPRRVRKPVSATRLRYPRSESKMRLLCLVHDLGGEVASIEVGHEAANLATLELEDTHTLVGNPIPVRSTLRRPLKSRPVLGGEYVAELGFHLAEGTTVARPELAQAFVTSEGPCDRDVAHLAVLSV